MVRLLSAVVLLLVFFAEILAADLPKLRTLPGAIVEGELVSLSNKELVLKSKEGPVATPLADVMELNLGGSLAPFGAKCLAVELTDGTLLYANEYSLKGKQLTIKTVLGQDLKLPLDCVAYLVNDAQDPKVRDDWKALIAKKNSRDLLAIKDAEGKVNGIDGTLGDADNRGETIAFETAGGVKRQINFSKIHGMNFVRRLEPDTADPVCKVYDAGRGVLVARTLTFDDKGFSVATMSGVKVDYSRDLVVRLDFSKGKLTYLSDLDPLKVGQPLGDDRIGPYRRDKNVEDGGLRLAGKDYSKGLSMLSYTELVYDIGGQYKDFKCVLGVDERAGGASPIKVLIEADGRELFSGQLKPKDPPRPVAFDVKNVKQLRIVVAPVNLLDLDANINLADAKVTK